MTAKNAWLVEAAVVCCVAHVAPVKAPHLCTSGEQQSYAWIAQTAHPRRGATGVLEQHLAGARHVPVPHVASSGADHCHPSRAAAAKASHSPVAAPMPRACSRGCAASAVSRGRSAVSCLPAARGRCVTAARFGPRVHQLSVEASPDQVDAPHRHAADGEAAELLDALLLLLLLLHSTGDCCV